MANLSSQNVGPGNSLNLSAGVSAGPVAVQSSGKLIVDGGQADQVTVYNMGNATVTAGGVMNTVTAVGGLVNVLSNGTANNVTMTSSAYMNVLSGGTGNNVDVQNGVLAVSGLVSGVKVANGALLKMDANGIASAITLAAGGSAGNVKQVNGTANIAAMQGNAFAGVVTGLNAVGSASVVSGAQVNGGTFASGTFTVDGGIVSGLTIANRGILTVSAPAAVITGINVVSGGSLRVNGKNTSAAMLTLSNGGRINNFTQVGSAAASIAAVVGNAVTGNVNNVSFDGTMNAAAGAVLNNITVHNGALYLSSGANVSNLTVITGSAYAQAGASAASVSVVNGGVLRVANGASVSGLTLYAGGKALDFVQTGATAAVIDTVAGNGIGGTISNLNAYGNINILDNATVVNLTVAADGNATLNSHASASAVVVRNSGYLAVKDAAVVNGATIENGGRMNVSAGGTATAVTLNKGGLLDVVVSGGDVKTLITGTNEAGAFSYSNGVATNFVVYEGQNFVVSSGGSARNIVAAAGGIVSAAMGADVTGYSSDMKMSFSIKDGAVSGLTNLANFELAVGYGYAIDGQKLHNGGVQSVASGGKVNGTVINSGGEIRVGYNGSATDIIQSNGGKISVDVYHSAALTTVKGKRFTADNKEKEFMLESGSAIHFAISSGASMVVHSGGTAIETEVLSGGKMILSSGANVQAASLAMGAILSANVIGGDSNTVFTAEKSYNGLKYDMQLKNGSATEFIVDNGGRLNVYSSGVANNVIVDDSFLSVGYAGQVSDVIITNGGSAFVDNNGSISNVEVQNGGYLKLADGAVLDGTVSVAGTISCDGSISFTDGFVAIDLANRTAGSNVAVIENLSFLSATTLSVTVKDAMKGDYILATGAMDFAGTVSVYRTNGISALGVLNGAGTSFQVDSMKYSLLENKAGDLVLSISNPLVDDSVAVNLLSNDVSQIVAWDAAQGKVGYVATTGQVAPSWAGIWEWGGQIDLGGGNMVAEKDLWRVAAVGHFKGSKVDYDGVLLYNGIGNTFAAWTDLRDPSYGYVDLCHVEGNFQTQCLTNLDGDEYDDVLIYDEKGSFGVVSGGTEWHSIWDAPAGNVQQLVGAGNFGSADGKDSLLVKKTDENAYFLWHNNDPTFRTWDWSQTYIGTLDNDWTVAGIGDFQGDGTDDIIMWQKSTGYMFAWENGDSSNQRFVGELKAADWEVAAVGDYNGDGKEDLLLRELNTGWGGVGYWGAGYAGNWTDLNARIETNKESSFSVIA